MTSRPIVSRPPISSASWATTRRWLISISAWFSLPPNGMSWRSRRSSTGWCTTKTIRRSRCCWPTLCSSSTEASRPSPWLIATSSGRLRSSRLTSYWPGCSRRSNREKEITPRLEAAARRDSKNVPLQYVLADRYRETGENDKAEALYKELLTSQPTPQTYRALANSLLKRKKAADFLKVVSEALKRPESLEAIKPQLAGCRGR